MASDLRPLSEHLAQGWELQGYSANWAGSVMAHSFLLKRQKQLKVLTVRPKYIGWGDTVEEKDV